MSISIVLLPCTGRIEEAVLLRAFEKGADGVMVIGCLEGDCHYVNGNIRARARVGRVAGILETIGFGSERVRMVQPQCRRRRRLCALYR